MKKAILLAALAFSGFAAQAVPLANNMTCAEAQAYYARNGRVWVQTYSGDVVPIYGDNRNCTYAEEAWPVWVRTTDTNSCTVAYRCRLEDDRGN